MSVIYNADEIYEMGIQIEKNGQAFYEAAAEAAADSETRKLLSDLARWEETHVALFSDLKKKLPGDLQEDPRLDLDQQKAIYLKAAADSHIFTKHRDPKALAKTCKGPLDVLNIAMDFEKDSVVLYTAMKDLVPENLGKETIDKLIKEEMGHIALIQNWMQRLY
jgi:rubrerythrin